VADSCNNTASAWAARAGALARWALANLVNRTDVYGRYLPLPERTAKGSAVVCKENLTRDVLVRHFRGRDVGDLVGLHTTSAANTCRWVLIDIDHHGPEDRRRQRANRRAAIRLYDQLRELHFRPLLLASNGRGGYHLLVLLDRSVPAATAYAFGRWLIRDWRGLGLAEEPEAFPRQPKVGGKVRYGNWVRLPGRHHTRAYHSAVWTGERWARDEDAIEAILRTTGTSPTYIPTPVLTSPDFSPELVTSPALAARPGRASGRRDGERPVEAILSRLKHVSRSGQQWSARCPAHNDTQNSLSVAEGDDGRALLYCHAGCAIDEVVEALGLSMRDLFPRGSRRRKLRSRKEE
jgi:hypothetical protein